MKEERKVGLEAEKGEEEVDQEAMREGETDPGIEEDLEAETMTEEGITEGIDPEVKVRREVV